MTYVASHVGTVPARGFEWYLIFLEGSFADEIKKEIDAHFVTLGREIGENNLAVRGFDPATFRESVFEADAFNNVKWNERVKFPSLIVTNRAPSDALSDANILESGKVMVFPLAELYREQKSLAGFLSELVEALKKEDAMAALESVDGKKLEKGWGWLSKYFKMEPGFFGFSLKLNDAIRDLLAH
jgi:hypothetical protein